MPLTPRQRTFVEAYLVSGNATQAYQQAGYRSRTSGSARAAASRLLTRVNIQAAIQERQQTLQQQYEITQGKVLQELAAIAFADMGVYAQWTQDRLRLTPSTTLSAGERQAVKAVVASVTSAGSSTCRIVLHDKIAALDKLARHLGLYQEHPPDTRWVGMVETEERVHEVMLKRLDAMAQKAREADAAARNGQH